MSKKIILFAALCCTGMEYASDLTSWIEFKPSYFFFATSPMNEIYNQGGFEVQASASVPCCDHFDFYGSIGYRQAWGHALNSDEKTNLLVVPFDIGLKPVIKFDEHFSYFFAAGPRFFFFHQHNDSIYVTPKIDGSNVGFFINTGFNVEITEYFLLGIFGEYSYEKTAFGPKRSNVFSNGNTQIGGFAFGLSFGYEF